MKESEHKLNEIANAFMSLRNEFKRCEDVKELGKLYVATKEIIDRMFMDCIDKIIE